MSTPGGIDQGRVAICVYLHSSGTHFPCVFPLKQLRSLACWMWGSPAATRHATLQQERTLHCRLFRFKAVFRFLAVFRFKAVFRFLAVFRVRPPKNLGGTLGLFDPN
jgi:hypothetical protein